jgi:toxin CcdB
MQCGVHRNVDDATGEIPFLLDVQADLLSDLETRVVIPLVRRAAFGRPASRLHPVFTVADEQVVMATHLLAAVRRRSLGAPIASLEARRDVIIAAIDVIWSGV